MSPGEWVVWIAIAGLEVAAMAASFGNHSDAWSWTPAAVLSVLAVPILVAAARRRRRSLAQVGKALGGAAIGTLVLGVIAWVPLLVVVYVYNSELSDVCRWERSTCAWMSGMETAPLAWIVAMGGAPRVVSWVVQGVGNLDKAAVRTGRWWILLGSFAVAGAAHLGDGVAVVAIFLALPGLWMLLAAAFLFSWRSVVERERERPHRERERPRRQRRARRARA